MKLSCITTLVSHLKNCSNIQSLQSIYALTIKNSTNQDCFLINQFINFCVAFRRMDFATLAFTQMDSPNVFVFNALLRGFVQCNSYPVRAFEFYLHMLKSGVFPNSFTFSALVKACRVICAKRLGESVHCHIWKHGLVSHVFVQTALIDFYSNLDGIGEAREAFDEMPERDVFAWTTMVSGYVRVGDMRSAQTLFDAMPAGRNIATWNTMISGYAKLGHVEPATVLFNEMPEKDLITWTTMISCYSQNKRFAEAIRVFEEMKTVGLSPDEVTMSSVISACAHLGALDLGREIHCYLLCNGFDLDVYIGSALVDMYAKCGSSERSLVVFFKLREKNLFCWNSVIEGLALHGHGVEALEMFKMMERNEIKPNGVTFVSVLSACNHAGLVDEARKRFLSMVRDYFISPGIKHYGCMVDLLSRAGLLEEALELINDMNVEPNSVIWGAILGGCKLHGNLQMAQVAVEKLMCLEPDNSGYYGLLINMYAEANRWSEVAKVRVKMKDRRVQKKCPGSSWIEMDGTLEEFVASDTSHPMYGEIGGLLSELYAQLRLKDYLSEVGLIS